MSTLFACLALPALYYRYRQGLAKRTELILAAFWATHLVIEFLQLFFDLKSFHFEIRFFQPADFLTFGWLAWGALELWRRFRFLRFFMVIFALCAVTYDTILLVKAQLPVGRRSAYAAACEWAVDAIKRDWRGAKRDNADIFDIKEYHLPNRPIIDAFSARVPYLVGGRLDVAEAVFADVDKCDYWVHDLHYETPPATGFDKIGVFKRNGREFELYRRRP